MKLAYYPETDSLYIELRSVPSVETVEVSEGILLDLDARGQPVGLDIDHASKNIDLSDVTRSGFPHAA